ncbi:MAG TPA: NAD(P)-dependent oxidoreductase, partial [Spirochaetia bacterium]|nr:NAD(P)-dependent oxidoreductase [Spirochaetia bacterium]
MKVFVIGITGLLGLPATRLLLQRGFEVRGIARTRPEVHGSLVPNIEVGDIAILPDESVLELLTGSEALIYAIGADERVAHPAPAYPFFRKENVDDCVRVVRLARKARVRRLILLGSYFVHFNRVWPELRLSEHHPYIRSRVEQESEVMEVAGTQMTVTILELPYIFGTMPGRTPIWSFL